MKVGQKEKGILNLEYCLRVQTHQKLMRKAYKILLMSHVEDHLFYEAVEVVKLGTICGIDLPNWANMVSAFMAIIKGHYEEGVAQLTSIYDRIKAEEERKKNIQRSNSHRRPPGSNRFCGHGN